jgi:hypothetical protein
VRRGWLYDAVAGDFQPDRIGEARISKAALRALAADGTELTWFGVPPGSGLRMALDRDRDGFYDRDELDAHTNPGDPRRTRRCSRSIPRSSSSASRSRAGCRTRSRRAAPPRCASRCARRPTCGSRFSTRAGGAWRCWSTSGCRPDLRAAWDGADERGRQVAPGVYFYRLSALGQRLTAKGVRI